MSTYVFRDGRWRDKATGEPMKLPKRTGAIGVPQIMRSFEAHRSPSGAYIPNRKAMLDDCAAHGYVPYEKVSANPGGIADPKLAKQMGVRPCEKTQEWLAGEKAKIQATLATQEA